MTGGQAISAGRRGVVCAAVLIVLATPGIANAQAGVTGVVLDPSGAVLEGVHVESIETNGVTTHRSVLTDASGRFAILDLRPGTYDIRFTRLGFNAVTREGLELTGSFIADLTVALTIGTIDQSVTVKAATPLVDLRNTRQQASMTGSMVAALPTGRSLVNLGVLIPGVTPLSARSQYDVGGTNNLQNIFMAIHGGRISDQRVSVDGVPIRNIQTEGYTSNFTPDTSSAQEITIDYASASAEDLTGGIRANYVPREGSDRFQTSMFVTAADASFQGSNVTRDLNGLIQPDALKLTYDINPTGGGPIVAGRLWIYAAARAQTNQNYVSIFENRNAGDASAWSYDPDTARRGVFAITQNSANARLTWQPTPRHKVGVFYEQQSRVWDEGNVNRAPEAFSRFRFPVNQLGIASWSSPLSDRLVAEARGSYHAETWRNIGADDLLSNNRSLIPVLEQGGAYPGLMYRGKNGVYSEQQMPFIGVARGSVSYVTSTHAFKVGADLLHGTDTNFNSFNDSGIQYRFNNGTPNQITEFATPYQLAWSATELGLFAQDRWTRGRLAIDAGLRFDYYGTAFPETHLGPATLVPGRDITFPETSWYRLKDLSPRLGAVVDLSEDGRTALRVSANRYVVALPPSTGNPVSNLALSVTRTFTDSDRDYVADCDLQNPLSNGECGTISDLNFGTAAASTRFDPALLSGWNVRPFNWEFSAGIERELRPGVAVNAAFFRRVYGNFAVQDNLATTAEDYGHYSIVAPSDSRLPGGGGYTVGDLVDVNPDKRGLVQNYVTSANHYGRQIEHWNGADVTVDVRLRAIMLQGGLSSGRSSTDVCDIVDDVPEILGTMGALGTRQIAWSLNQCHVDTSLQTQVKFLGTYNVPKIDLQVAGTVLSSPGVELQANYVASNAVVQPSLGRPLTGAANAPVWLLPPGDSYGGRLNQVDLRATKVLRFGRSRAAINVDVYNALNANPMTAMNLNYTGNGSTWLQPQSILAARLVKVSVQFDY